MALEKTNDNTQNRHESGSHKFVEIEKDTLKSKSSGAAAKSFRGFYSVLGGWRQTILEIKFQNYLKVLLKEFQVIS